MKITTNTTNYNTYFYHQLHTFFITECNYGTFGEFCNNKCYCEGETCDGKTGICPSGQCLLGYRGANCSQGESSFRSLQAFSISIL